jgi:hypothetical protein
MTTFLRVLEETENKEAALLDTIRGNAGAGRSRYEADPNQFGSIERSPFAYWISDKIRSLFSTLPKLESEGRTAKQGLATADDFRFVRLWWEIPENQFRKRWFPFAKGGKYSEFYSDISLLINWDKGGLELKSFKGSVIRNPSYYRMPGITWTNSTTKEFSCRALPDDCIFSHMGPAVFFSKGSPASCLSILNSFVTKYLIKINLGLAAEGRKHYEIGVLQGVPFKEPNEEQSKFLYSLSFQSWVNRFRFTQFYENNHSFIGPALLAMTGTSLLDRASSYGCYLNRLSEEFQGLQEEVNATCFNLYGISSKDRELILRSFQTQETPEPDSNTRDDDEDLPSEEEEHGALLQNLPRTLAGDFISWSIGVVFGRFSLPSRNLEKHISQLPGPFDPIPVRSPGMQSLAELATPADCQLAIPSNGILVDDAGNPELDLVAQMRRVVEFLFTPGADAWWQELCQALDPKQNDLRNWLRKDFFQQHLSQYSASRRKAPIYWPIATASKGYTLWLYSHRVTSDTLYRVVELVRSRKRDADLKWEGLKDPSGAEARRDRSDLELLVEELKELLAELERIQPLFHPNLDDGAVLVLAPLHRLFKAYPAWQKELADRWKDLVRGEYDWSSQAMRLWPDRVVRKCQTDRSLAIAHGLDDFFWHPTEGDKAVPKAVQESDILAEIKARTERSVQDALRSLLEAAPQTKASARRAVTSTTRAPRATQPAASRPQGAAVGRKRSSSFDLEEAAQQVLAFLLGREGRVAKNEILEGTGLPASQWNRVMESLTQQGLVEKMGDKRGARYQAAPGQNRGEFP